MYCKDCHGCTTPCGAVDAFLDENIELMDDLAITEERDMQVLRVLREEEKTEFHNYDEIMTSITDEYLKALASGLLTAQEAIEMIKLRSRQLRSIKSC